ncbi:MAG: type II toxin-antitoxin system VapC family toxin [Anaerolineae bacterium]
MSGYYYLDTSAQVKYYVSEPGTAWIRQLVNATDPDTGRRVNQLFTATITVAEAAAAFAIIARTGRISEQIRDRTFNRYMKTVSANFHLLPVTESLIDLAAYLTQRYPLKGYDAVQVAAALHLQQTLGSERPLTFVAGDKSVIAAARAEGLTADNPFRHVAENETSPTPH